MADEDNNIKNAKQAANMALLQQKAQEYQRKLDDLSNKEYQGKCQGITVKMKGDYSLLDVHIDQSYYETAGKSQIESSIFQLFTNLHKAITQDQNALKDELQIDISAMQKEYQNGNN